MNSEELSQKEIVLVKELIALRKNQTYIYMALDDLLKDFKKLVRRLGRLKPGNWIKSEEINFLLVKQKIKNSVTMADVIAILKDPKKGKYGKGGKYNEAT